MHVIDEDSPLHGATRESLEESAIAEIVIVLSGVDYTFAQRIHARHSYLPARDRLGPALGRHHSAGREPAAVTSTTGASTRWSSEMAETAPQ